jgi:alpha-glucuronidase
LIHRGQTGAGEATVIASGTEPGTLYGAFAFVRLLQTGQPLGHRLRLDNPKNPLRIIAHWDNLDGTVERGYAGQSLWQWHDLPEKVDARLIDYARLTASLGINGVVVNNVNADPAFLDAKNLRKVAALAKTIRPFGLKVYLCANFAAR